MARSFALALSSLAAFALFSACGGVSDPGLFSPSGGAAGSSSGGAAQGGSTPAGGAASGGSTSTGGAAHAGANEGGGSNGGASSAGAGGEAQAGANQAGAGGTAQAGTGGANQAGAGGTNQAGAGGAAHAGAGGSSAGAAGSAGAGELSCSELFSQANAQLEAARACNLAVDAEQCTGKVTSTCNCEVAVERGDSPETNAYLATLKQIQKKKCQLLCPAIACLQVNHAVCRPSSAGSSAGVCTASFGGPTP